MKLIRHWENILTVRVLALSATPGNKIDNVHEVLQNLLIAHIELRDETSVDIIPYINKRRVDIILVPLNKKLAEYKERYIFIMDRHVKILLQHNILHGHTANISKGRIFHLLKEYQKKTHKSGNYGQIIKTLNILMTMYHAYELMIRDGLRAFHKFYQNHSDKFWMNDEPQLQTLLEDITMYLGPFPDIQNLCEEAEMEIPQNLIFGHTKFDKLKELLLHHFKKSEEKQSDTRAIVFVEYRDIVSEVYILLLQCRPLIRPQMFVGQAGQKQKQQIKALENFRNNHVNVLISTSIGEEGLDVGEVDLIICFDVSQHSPTRLVQRMGRTGRKRDGHIIILVTDGKEHETLKSTMARRDSLNYKIINTSNIFSSLYQNNPRMIPDVFTPECLRMQISVQPKSPVTKYKKNKGKSDKKSEKKCQNTLKKISNTESNFESQKDGTNFTMMKYLKIEQIKEHKKGSSETFNSEIIQNNNGCKTIPLSDVKILSCDNEAVDFLTICALRISEKEEKIKNEYKIDKCHISPYSTKKDFFEFSIPDIKILDCLITLNDVIPLNCNKNKLDNASENNDDNDLYYNESVLESKITEIVDKSQRLSCSRFEDLLDDSSDSNENDLLDNEENNPQNSNIHSICDLSIASDRCAKNDILEPVEAGNKNNTLQDLEFSTFEDLLDETSDDSETDNFERNCTKDTDVNNDVQVKNSPDDIKLNHNFKSKINISLEGTIEINENFSSTPVHQCKRDFEKNCNEETADKSSYPSKIFEFEDNRIFSITQAIEEIPLLNSNSIDSKTIEESEDDIFQDESFLQQIDDQSNYDKEMVNPIEYKDEQNFDKSEKPNGSNDRSVDTELKVEEFEWNDDFEVPTDAVENYAKFDTFEEKRKSETLVEAETDHEAYFSDDEEWISFKKSMDISKQNASPCTTIAKKLANVTKCRNSKNSCSRNKNDSMNDDLSAKEERSIYFVSESNDTRRYKSKKNEVECFRKRNRNRKLRKTKNEFICEEAEISPNDDTADESSETDDDLEDFVRYTQDIHDTSDMHAHYLQTVRSPIKRQGGFIFKQQRTLNSSIDVYSQALTQTAETYINDSFCIAEDKSDGKDITRDSELSELEKAELKLEKRKRKRYRDKKSNQQAKRSKRRNIINYFSSSSEDEAEILRKQIKDESMLLKQL
ncbi:Fanconi anemia group M protein isoform X2 [Bombus terrestris]|uniref:Fanconi anemia group M protein isoform X2 n=1 Tax=Bombus terrestris TaxID=30195 RepID=A0A9C6SPE0_BOMTE|nr:Fanconi anemia group M protein isoform X2 [Bombus terrestris]